MRVSPGDWLFTSVAWIGMVAVPCFACTVSLPEIPSNEFEIEVEFEDYDSVDDRVHYKIEIEVQLFAPASTVQCSCALNLGSSSSLAPATFDVTSAIVGIRGGSEVDLIPFDGFTRDSQVESDVANLTSFNNGSTPFGFSLDVSPFSVPTLSSNDLLTLIFEIEFDPADFDEVNGSSIQFAAGSNEPGHLLNIFQGYEATLQLPEFVIPEPHSLLLGLLGMIPVAVTRGRR